MGLEAVLLFFFVLSPGLIADALYRFFLWRPEPEEQLRFTRALLFSVVGIVLHLLVVEQFNVGLPEPLYLLPDWWRLSWQADLSSAGQIILPWTLHTGICVAFAGVTGWVMERDSVKDLLRTVTGQSLHRTAWDEFASSHHQRWVIVRLVDGRHYYGRLGIVSGENDGDFVLWNPYPYDPKADTYLREGAEGMFVPEDQVASVVVPMTEEKRKLRQDAFGVYNLKTGERVNGQGREG